ncbi:MAG TPA: hypothetical protein VHW23_23740, partial [Kofleriaceae bacterium]|nr:hypothetical protein [Kofleriaceae bacterium]
MARLLASLVALAPAVACSSARIPDAATTAWTAGTTAPRHVQQAGVAARGLDVVVAGGYDVGPAGALEITARVDVYNAANDTWQLPGTVPDAPVHWTDINLAALGDIVYLAGGL